MGSLGMGAEKVSTRPGVREGGGLATNASSEKGELPVVILLRGQGCEKVRVKRELQVPREVGLVRKGVFWKRMPFENQCVLF